MYTFAGALNKILFAVAFLGVAGNSMAAGSYISEVGTPGSLGTAGAANPTNTFGADSAWTNPAGMTGLDEETIYSGLQVVVPKVEFDVKSAEFVASGRSLAGDSGGNAGVVAPVPSFFYVKPISERTRLGFSMAAPIGGGLDFGSNFVGRYAIQEVSLSAVGITPSVGFKVNENLSIGAGVTFLYTALEQEIALRQPGESDGVVKFEEFNDWGYQGILSLTYKLSDSVLFGAVYRTKADIDLEGDIRVENVLLPQDIKKSASLSWDNPQWLDLGLRYRVNDRSMLFLSAGWQDWSNFSENVFALSDGQVETLDRNWDDTWYVGIGFAHGLGDSAVSVGISYESSPVDDENRTFDLPVDEMLKLSTSYSWKRGNFGFGLGATLYLVGDAPIDQTSQGVRVVGDFDSNVIMFAGGTLSYKF